MKLLSCILFASLAVSASLVHADAPPCKDAPGFSRESAEALKVFDRGSGSSGAPVVAGAASTR